MKSEGIYRCARGRAGEAGGGVPRSEGVVHVLDVLVRLHHLHGDVSVVVVVVLPSDESRAELDFLLKYLRPDRNKTRVRSVLRM